MGKTPAKRSRKGRTKTPGTENAVSPRAKVPATEHIERAVAAGLMEENRRARQSRRMQERYAKLLYRLLLAYLLYVGAVVLLAGWRIRNFELSENVLIALIHASALSGLMGIVIAGLFPPPRRPSQTVQSWLKSWVNGNS